jgi:hypothetical protein
MEAAAAFKTSAQEWPMDLGEGALESTATPELTALVEAIGKHAGAGDAAALTELFAPDAALEDLTLRNRIRGPLAIGRYLARTLDDLPYGTGVRVRTTLGGRHGGFEWTGKGSYGEIKGISSLILSDDGRIMEMTSVWDGALLDDAAIGSLVSRTID